MKDEILHIWHVCDVENVAICAKFIAIHAVLLLNLLFTLFCREIYFATIYALLCGEKLSPKIHLWRKNDKYEVCATLTCLTACLRSMFLCSMRKAIARVADL